MSGRIPDSLQSERRGTKRRGFLKLEEGNRVTMVEADWRDALGQGARHILRWGNAGR